MTLSIPSIATPVPDVIKSYPKPAQRYAAELRSLILDTAQTDPRIGALTETLKWREPSYLTDATKSGTTLRFGWKEKHPDKLGLFVNCRTTLIRGFQDMVGDALSFEGNRAIWLDINKPLPRDILAIFISKTLTYHLTDG